jgi:hypothetical protein
MKAGLLIVRTTPKPQRARLFVSIGFKPAELHKAKVLQPMKKLSAVQLKQQAAVLAAVEALEQQAMAELSGVIQGWFSLEYEAFPASLLVRLQFATEENLADAQPQLLVWQKRFSGLMLKKGVILKDMRKHLVFTCMAPDD